MSTQEERVMDKLNNLYASIKRVYLDLLLKKANNPDYIGATFDDAMQLSITSNSLSLIKGFIQNNHYSITHALNMRNIIECLGLIKMDKSGDISDKQKEELFVEQYKLIKYRSYSKSDKRNYSSIINYEKLGKAYLDAKKVFLKYGFNENKFKKIEKNRIPFLCDEEINYYSLLKQYYRELLEPYIVLSMMIHPSSYHNFRNDDYYNQITGQMFALLIELYGNNEQEKELRYDEEDKETYSKTLIRKLLLICNKQAQICKDIRNFFNEKLGKSNFVSNFFNELMLVIHDINTDSHLGFTENIKSKFKVIVEMFACFNKVYFVEYEKGEYLYDMLNKHYNYKLKSLFNIDTNEDIKMLYENYKGFIKKVILQKIYLRKRFINLWAL